MIESNNKKISVRKQCELLDVNRTQLNPAKPNTTKEDYKTMAIIDEIYLQRPHYETRNYRLCLNAHG